MIVALSSASIAADTFYEVSTGIGQLAIDVDQKRGQQIEDNSKVANLGFGAYRMTSPNSAWGTALELAVPIGRDEALPGSGKIIALRVADYWYRFNDSNSIEVYAGFAQFDWKKKANGYYTGANYRYNVFGKNAGLMLEAKYYQDLAYDSPEGDDVVDGFNTSIKLFLQF